MKIHEMEINITRSEFETLKAEVQVVRVEACPLEAFTKFRDNVQTDHASFVKDIDDKLNSLHNAVNGDMKTIIVETKNEFDKTQSQMEEKITHAAQQYTTTQLQYTAIRDEVNKLGATNVSVHEVVQQLKEESVR